MDVKVVLKDGNERLYPQGTRIMDIVSDISERLAKEAIVARLNGRLVDLFTPVEEDSELEVITFDMSEAQEVFRHSTSHIMAQAVMRLFPDAKLAIGPSIKDGFYYDFDMDTTFSPEDLQAIEKEMQKIIKADYEFSRKEVPREEAIKYFKETNQPYKVELIEDLPEESTISMYKQGEFVDLCAGPHVPSTGKIKAVKLLSTAGAYWRGSERNPMLQRIYGTSFPKKSLLDEYLKRMEEARKRDHRKLGVQLDLFSMHDEAPGFPFFHNKGMIVRNLLEDFWREEHKKWGYEEVKTPIVLRRELWEQSGHWDHYKENMYFTKLDDADFALKPMNCPGGMILYKTKQRSYRDLPLRVCELGLVHRHELSGVLHGLMRVRAFTQDDAHLYMLPSQIKDEIIGVMDLIDRFYSLFGFEYHVELSTKPENAMGSDEVWEKATEALREAAEASGRDYVINEGDGAFYGPKLDFHLKDCLGRTWQCGTIQLDMLMPELFDLTYIGQDGEKHRPVMLHRTVLGSIERFIGILIEHFAGAFPTWLAPVQTIVLPIAERHLEYADSIKRTLEDNGIRVEVDARNEKIGYKIREAEIQKIPYMLVVGDNEAENGTVSVRKQKEGDQGSFVLEDFISGIKKEINDKAYN